MGFLGEVSEVARRIGAVNTITVSRAANGSRVLTGTNTDWNGIARPVRAQLLRRGD